MNWVSFRRVWAMALFAGLAHGTLAWAADDGTARAMKVFEKRDYVEAARLLRSELATAPENRQAALALGMVYLNSAIMYRELQRAAVLIELDYLSQLGRQKSAASHASALFLGKVLLESGKPDAAATQLKKYLQGGVTPLGDLAKIELGVAYSKQKNVALAKQVWAEVKSSRPELKSAMAGAYAATGMLEMKPVAMADAAWAEMKTQGKELDMRTMRNLLRAYSYAGATEKALELLDGGSLNAAAFVEEPGHSKVINFYEVGLLGDIGRVHLDAAVMYLARAGKDHGTTSAISAFYLSDAYLLQGQEELATRAAILSQDQLPASYKVLAKIKQASAQYVAGKKTDAMAAWLEVGKKAADDPVLLAAAMQACFAVAQDCAGIEKLALAAVDKGEGKKYFVLNAALGRYYLKLKDYPKAIAFMEAGRDKANKNKIDANDPLLLIGLAEAYYRTKKFSENLEIYFELGKTFPAVRQIQEAMQGIYSVEQQSAGDVKIY